MADLRAFLETPRKMPDRRPVEERLRDWREVYREQRESETRAQASRCMDCGVPFCQQGCPLGNLIPDWNELVREDDWRTAYRRLASTNNFPEFTGRLCPAPCEAACTLAINTDAVTIEQIEKEIVERAFAEGWVKPRPSLDPTERSVAIVGSGPAGLAAAEQLVLAGHQVTVYERADRVGGLLRYGIPDFKMEKHVLDRRLDLLRAQGVVFETGVNVGTDVRWDALRDDHDAVLVAIGAARPRALDVPGAELDGVVFAMDYLEAQNRVVAGDDARSPIHAEGLHVVVLGGGDTGSDCVGTANRQGAASVTQIEILEKPPASRASDNPWPNWPVVFRTSSSHEEGAERAWGRMTTEVVGSEGRVTGLRMQSVSRSADGGFVPLTDAVEELRCDLLILAMGFTSAVAPSLEAQLGLSLTGRGRVPADAEFRTGVDGVWAAGDASRGASLIVWAISDGREAARSIDAALRGGRSVLPSRGRDDAF